MGFLPKNATLDQFPPAPRTVVWRPLARSIRAAIVAVAIFVLFFGGALVVNRHQRFVELCTKGVQAEASVVSKTGKTGRDASFRLNYELAVEKGVARGFKEVDLHSWDVAEVGDLVQVTYLPDDPSNNRPGSVGRKDAEESLAAVFMYGAGFLLVTGFAILISEGIFREEYRLARLGSVATATNKTVEVQVSGRFGPSTLYRVESRYKGDGDRQRVVISSSESMPRELRGESSTTVMIYMLGDPPWHQPWPLFKYVDIADR